MVAPHALTLGASGVITELASRHRLPGVFSDPFLPSEAACCRSALIRQISFGALEATCAAFSMAKSRRIGGSVADQI